MAENAAAVETVEAMQSVVGQPVVALAQTQNLDYIENVDQSNILTGILYGIKANQEVLQRIEDNTANQTQALEQQADIQEEQIRESGDVAGETALEQPAGGGILTDAFKEKSVI
jgi:AmiR/NasT family two-component response regulator